MKVLRLASPATKIAIVMTILFLGACALLIHTCNRVHPPQDAILMPAVHDTVPVIRYRDTSGRNYVTFPNKPMGGTESLARYAQDTLAKAFNLALSDINELTRIKYTLEAKLKATEIERDANGRQLTHYRSKYMQITTDSRDSSLAYKYTGDMIWASIDGPARWFKRRDMLVTITSTDTNWRPNGVERYQRTVQPNNDFMSVSVYSDMTVPFQKTRLPVPIIRAGAKATFNPDGAVSFYADAGYGTNQFQYAPGLTIPEQPLFKPYFIFGIEATPARVGKWKRR